MPFEINAKNKSVLIISDTHIPYSHKDYYFFLKEIKKKYKPDIVTHIGDELDYHAISMHKSDSSLFSADHELDAAIIEIQEGLHKLFPRMRLLESNHGSLVFRRLKVEGISIRHLKPLHKLYETPKWSWHDDILLSTNLGKVYMCHGKSGAYGRLCKDMGASAIQGHFHTKSEITWHKTIMGTRFNMFVGCLVDADSMAMAYGRNNLPLPIMSVGFINANGTPELIRMNLDKHGSWDGIL
jgi:hypothetical protein